MIELITSEKFLLQIIDIAIIIAVGVLVYYIVKSIILSSLKIRLKSKRLNVKRQKTLTSVTINIVKYVIIVVEIIIILKQIGVNTTSLLASVGILSLILGWALQDTIKDFAAGFFIIADREYEVGDYVEIDGFFGEVKEMGLKTTKVLSWTGEIKTFNNSTVGNVINYSQHNNVVVIDIGVDYKEHTDKVIKALNDLIPEIEKIDGVKKDIEVLGVQDLEESSVKYRMIVEAKPSEKFAINRKILKLIKDTFDEKGIKIPYPQIEVHNGKK